MPSAFLVAASSSGPSISPWILAVPALVGAPLPMIDSSRIMVGRSFVDLAVSMCFAMVSTSYAELDSVCQPYPE